MGDVFEISFNIDVERKKYTDFLYDSIKNCLREISAVVSYIVDDDRVFLSFGCKDESKEILVEKCIDLLTDIYVYGFKYDYLKYHLNIRCENLLIKTLLKTMTIFDSKNDKYLIKRELEKSKVDCIDGFFNFRLKEVKKKWDEIIELTNENSIVLSDNDVAVEFLSFLLESMPKRNKAIRLCSKGDEIVLLDEKGNEIKTNFSFLQTNTDEDLILFNIIYISPSKVIVKNRRDFSSEFLSIIDKFF